VNSKICKLLAVEHVFDHLLFVMLMHNFRHIEETDEARDYVLYRTLDFRDNKTAPSGSLGIYTKAYRKEWGSLVAYKKINVLIDSGGGRNLKEKR